MPPAPRSSPCEGPAPTSEQVQVSEEIVAWYLRTYWLSDDDLGTPATFFDRDRVGEFAVEPRAFEVGQPAALDRVLVAVTLFQRLRDQLVLKILRGLPKERVLELTNFRHLAMAADDADCEARRSVEGLRNDCDLSKDTSGNGVCSYRPRGTCALHQHAVDLRRYGHFGKVPTSLALSLRTVGASSVADLYPLALRRHSRRVDRATELEQTLSTAWRVSDKISAMFLSLVCTPGLSRWRPPWRSGVAWDRFVIIDSNVDVFLSSIGYSGPGTYRARRGFITEIAKRIDLRRHSRRLHAFNPRVVQQAVYVFAGKSNRAASQRDCRLLGPDACRSCPSGLSERCPVATRGT